MYKNTIQTLKCVNNGTFETFESSAFLNHSEDRAIVLRLHLYVACVRRKRNTFVHVVQVLQKHGVVSLAAACDKRRRSSTTDVRTLFKLGLCDAAASDEQVQHGTLANVLDGFLVCDHREVVLIALQQLVARPEASAPRWAIESHLRRSTRSSTQRDTMRALTSVT